MIERLTSTAGAVAGLPFKLDATIRGVADTLTEIQGDLGLVLDVPGRIESSIERTNELLERAVDQLATVTDEIVRMNEQLVVLIRTIAPLERAAQRSERVAQAIRGRRPKPDAIADAD